MKGKTGIGKLVGWTGLMLTMLFLITGCQSHFWDKQRSSVQEVKLIAIGDNLIHSSVYDAADAEDGVMDGKYNFKPMYKSIKGRVKSADIAFVNQETIISGKKYGLYGYPKFNTPEDVLPALKDTGFTIANAATNHSLDRTDQGAYNAIKNFKRYKMDYIGINTSAKEAKKIKVVKKNGISFAFLAYTYGTNGIQAKHDYTVNYIDDKRIKRDVKKARQQADIVIVSMHWGTENSFAPDDWQVKLAKKMADWGVDLIIGTHPHSIQPVQWIKGKGNHKMLVTYSLGNGLNGMLETQNMLGCLFTCKFVKTNQKIQLKEPKMEPIVSHFERIGEIPVDVESLRKNAPNADHVNYTFKFRLYPLSEYSSDQLSRHFINVYQGENAHMEDLQSIYDRVISKEFRKVTHENKEKAKQN